MATIYERLEQLCEENGITGGKMCGDLAMSRSTMTELRKGRVTTLKLEKAKKIADYFGVSVDYLLTGEQKENAPTVTGKGVSDDDIKFALFGRTDIDDAVMEEVKRFAKFAEENSRGGKK